MIIFIAGRHFNDKVISVIKALYPEKHITSITFRRVLPSLIYKRDVHPDNMTMQDYLLDYSHYNNTSYGVSKFTITKF